MTPVIGESLTRRGVALDVHARELRKAEPGGGHGEQQEVEMARIEFAIDVAALLSSAESIRPLTIETAASRLSRNRICTEMECFPVE